MKSAKYQEAMFSLIEELIDRLSRRTTAFVSHDAIASAYRRDPVVEPILVRRQNRLKKWHPLEWLASNDVQWFSAKYSTGALPTAGRFIRSRVNGKWAYRSV